MIVNHKAVLFKTEVQVGGRPYEARAIILPRIDPPHVSYDSPRKFYARPAKVIHYSLYEEDEDMRGHVPWNDRTVSEQILEDYKLSIVADKLMGVLA